MTDCHPLYFNSADTQRQTERESAPPGARRRRRPTYFVDEDDGRLQFNGQREDGGGQLLRLSVPLVGQRTWLQVDEAEPRPLGRGLGNQSFTAAWRAVQQHS